jgi:hypothetical protein
MVSNLYVVEKGQGSSGDDGADDGAGDNGKHKDERGEK